MENKKGLSAVVTTLIIILLVLVAVGIVWVVVRNVVDTGAEQIEISSQCLAIDVQAVSVNETAPGNYSITLRRSAGGNDIGGLKVVLFNSTLNSGVLDFGATPDQGETVTQTVAAGVANADELEYTVYFVDDSGNEQLCSQTGTFEF